MKVHTIRALGLRLRVVEDGTGDAVLLVHGVGGWAENWQEVLAPLAASGRRAIALDLPGFGESEAPGRVRYFDPERPFYGELVWAALDALGVERAHLVGSSLGGAVVAVAALLRPERTLSLTLAAGAGFGPEVARPLRIAALPGFGLVTPFFRRGRMGGGALRACFHDPSRIPEHLLVEVRRYGARSFPELVRVLRAGVGLRGIRPAIRDRWLARAARYTGPVLVVWGREDRVLPPRQAEAARDAFAGARLVLIDRCGHLPMCERPEEFLAALLPFLDRAAAATG